MATLPKDKLLEYLKHAIELESSIVAQEQIIGEYNKNSMKRKPRLQEKDLPEEVVQPKNHGYSPSQPVVLAFAFGLFMFIVTLLIYSSFGVKDMWSLTPTFDDGSSGINLIYVVGIPCLCCCIPLIYGAYKHAAKAKAEQSSYAEQQELYHSNLEQVRCDNEKLQAEYKQNMTEWNRSNQNAHRFFAAPLKQTKDSLAQLYARDIIYPKYRTLPALTSIYEYLITGRCEELAGPHGAYNLYEDEVRKDTVISQLNTVIENLEQIRQNQYMLYEQVKGIQRATQAIAIELNQIKGYTALLTEISTLNLYYNGINAMNSTALAYCRSL